MHRLKINKKNLTEVIQKNIAMALQEDIGNIDLSSELIEEKSSAKAYVKSKDSAVISGIPWFNATFLILDPKIKIKWFIKEGAMDGFSEYLKKISVLTGCKKLDVLQPSDFRSEQLFLALLDSDRMPIVAIR